MSFSKFHEGQLEIIIKYSRLFNINELIVMKKLAKKLHNIFLFIRIFWKNPTSYLKYWPDNEKIDFMEDVIHTSGKFLLFNHLNLSL